MAIDHNSVTIFGRCTRDPVLTYNKDNVAECDCGLASNYQTKDSVTGEIEKFPTFVEFLIRGRSGEAFAAYHTKGDRIFLEGRLKNVRHRDGMRVIIRVQAWQFVGGNHPKKPRAEGIANDGERNVVEEGPF